MSPGDHSARDEPQPGVTLEPALTAEIARQLHAAERSRVPIEQISLSYSGLTIEDSYAIQREWTALKLGEGRRIIGHKIGLTSRAMQQAAQIDEPDYGAIFDDMAINDGDAVDTARFIEPRLEAEFAFVLARPLTGPNVTVVDVLNATDYGMPALELIDARIERVDRHTNSPRTVHDTIADNAANAAIIVGGRPMRPDAVDWRWTGALLHKNGVIEESGLGAAVLNHPATGVAWLANKLAGYGEHLAAGEIVLSGSFTRPVNVAAGDTFFADYGPLGSVAVQFL